MKSTPILAVAAILLLCQGGAAQANVIIVDSHANGRFGEPQDGGVSMVLGYVFTGTGEAITITPSGTIDINGPIVGPGGIDLPRSAIIGPFASAYTPLEEKLVDAGTTPPITDGTSTAPAVGALMGAFVPTALANNPAFSPLDSDVVPVGISSDFLFLIGAGPYTFISPGAGVLYLGINEPFVSNNSGSFTIDLSPASVPEPASLAMLGIGVVGMVGYGLRRRMACRV